MERALDAARRGVEHWRETRAKRSPMPEALWDAAVAAAREHGTWQVSRALRLNYESLRKRVEGQAKRKRGEPRPRGAAGFVELDGAQVLGGFEREVTTLELSRPDGARLTIHLEGCREVDLPAVLERFLRSGG